MINNGSPDLSKNTSEPIPNHIECRSLLIVIYIYDHPNTYEKNECRVECYGFSTLGLYNIVPSGPAHFRQ